jgi:hypothetical protein
MCCLDPASDAPLPPNAATNSSVAGGGRVDSGFAPGKRAADGHVRLRGEKTNPDRCAACTAALKAEGTIGGTAGILLGIAPELDLAFGL